MKSGTSVHSRCDVFILSPCHVDHDNMATPLTWAPDMYRPTLLHIKVIKRDHIGSYIRILVVVRNYTFKHITPYFLLNLKNELV